MLDDVLTKIAGVYTLERFILATLSINKTNK
jgi:hypothetical protein